MQRLPSAGRSAGPSSTNRFNPDRPYNELPRLPPRTSVETLATLKKAIGAARALADLRGLGDQIPNQAILIRAIMLQEAKLSSEIENVATTNDKLYRALSEERGRPDPHTKEVLRYEEALWYGYNRLKEGDVLTTRLFEQLVQRIKRVRIGVRDLPGTKIAIEQTGAVVYTPPTGEPLIRDLLDNLSEYIYNDDGVDPLIKLAVIHYQFEAIHPFSDGNGRTGRVLNILYLIERRLLDIPVLYMSRYILQHRPDYYTGLRRVTEQHVWEDWILYMLDAIEKTAIDTGRRIQDIRAALADATNLVRRELPKVYSHELIELVFQQPYTRIAAVATGLSVRREAASRYLRELQSIGLLSMHRLGRETLYVNDRLMSILVS